MRRNHHKRLLAARELHANAFITDGDVLRATAAGESTVRVSHQWLVIINGCNTSSILSILEKISGMSYI